MATYMKFVCFRSRRAVYDVYWQQMCLLSHIRCIVLRRSTSHNPAFQLSSRRRPTVCHFSTSCSTFRKDFRNITTKTNQLGTTKALVEETKESRNKKNLTKEITKKKNEYLLKNENIKEKNILELNEKRTLYKVQLPGQRLEPTEDDNNKSVSEQLVAHVVPCPIEPEDGNKDKTEDISEWVENKVQFRELPSLYMQLSKSRLTGLVVLSAMAGYGMSSGDFIPTTFALMSLGTFLTSCSANAMNQFFEVPFDCQMLRTRNRVLVRGLLSSTHSVGFAMTAGLSGIAILGLFVNPLSAAIAFSTWALYTMAYTPLKRISIINTWVGAVVGALPPLIGWSASSGSLQGGALVLAGILYAWQFPHFNALSWNLRKDYSRGGYRMMATTDPGLCRRVALRHCVGITGLCTLAPVIGLTTWAFALDTLPINLWFTWLAWRFHQKADSHSAKQLFRFSLLHLPIIMLLMIISKKKLSPDSEKNSLANWSVKKEF
ncbi:protoheme IX farnesyltransferase, mitochondrial-like [Antedon mediterranea]|uniref:protoheme IX farnesyltransferase, mitochondrial-like n=1 Tax=Antedon mediterranea TaxID=105859 RepID=UPI003AF616D4